MESIMLFNSIGMFLIFVLVELFIIIFGGHLFGDIAGGIAFIVCLLFLVLKFK